MKFGAVISKPNIMKKNYKSLSKALIISFVTIISAVVLSAVLFHLNHAEISDKLMNYFFNFRTDFSNKSFLEIYCGFLLSSLPLIIFCVIFGTCSLGKLPIIISSFISAFGMGSLASYIFSQYKLTGVEYFLLIIFPGKIIAIFALLLLSETAISSADQIKNLSKQKAGEPFEKKLYFARCTAILGLYALAALVDTGAIKIFSPLFSFS